MDTKTILNDASGRMQKAIDHLEEELLNIRAGKASINLYLAICAPWKPGDPEKPRPRRSAISSKYLLRAAVISFLIALALFCIPPWP